MMQKASTTIKHQYEVKPVLKNDLNGIFNDYNPSRAKCTQFLVDFARKSHALGEILAETGRFRPKIFANTKVLL